ncbi:16S rRNA (adenine(1518)-N(6)/adenine(1519)-N(6))-dimethyltransferase RsmA [Candidatus Phytoplasma phoenicium]|uniref:Dimethyladenosine transferase n=1 Tax=Candidatus Phytoplasma phoenicium TaxID=198422 RepID=A0A0L0MK39_9MOLU|nr:16S rRNA (adenine(1518)-N(6)/adenine(1519)-N(6))-dimethyltransferase RsmA [Candidatus Phytoplasma phoenicium]KND62660.1 dimethyladenosine transferase [Candidatus Phytoplasma phoenicium]
MHQHIFKKKYGQHFLYDLNLLKLIINQADLDNRNVVEVGPGKGSLTRLFLPKAKKVLLYEIDTSLKSFLCFDTKISVDVIYDDFLQRDLKADLQQYFQQEDVVLIGNLPYYITTPLLLKIIFLSQIKTFTIMIQKEIGLRLLASAKHKNYNALTVMFQSLTKIHKIKIVKKTMFYPCPTVDGIVLKFEKKKLSDQERYFIENNFFTFVKASFQQKRKNLLNNLHYFFKIEKSYLLQFFHKYQIPYNIRGEEINFMKFHQMASLFFDFFQINSLLKPIQRFEKYKT